MSRTYPQAFVFTMENGAVVRVVVWGEDARHGEGLAHNAAQEIAGEGVQVWDMCAAPLTWEGAENRPPEKVEILRQAGN